MPVVNSKYGYGKVIIRTNATETIQLADLAAPNSAIENVASASINRVYWVTDGSWTVARGANTILNLSGEGDWDLVSHGISLSEGATANIVITGSGNGTIILEVSKNSVMTVNSEYLGA